MLNHFSRIISILFLLICFEISATTNTDNVIILNKKEKTLTAPESFHYKWFANGKELPEKSRKIQVTQSGVYKVEFVNREGKTISEIIQVAVSSNGQIFSVFTIGDSTVQDYTSGYYPREGWGQVLPFFFNTDSVSVKNRAVGGTSSKNFYNNYWAAVKAEMNAGDFVFVQFGINDRSKTPTDRYAPYDTFKVYIRKYVADIKAKGATPILVSTVRRNSWDSEYASYDAYHEHPRAMREVATELNVPLIDLDGEEKTLMESLGRSYVQPYWFMRLDPGEYSNYSSGNTDDVHYQISGATEMARIIAQTIENNTTAFTAFDTLKRYLKERHQITVLKNEDNAGMVTRTQDFPQGIEVTLKARPNPGYIFKKWLNTTGVSVSTAPIYKFTMGSDDALYTAVFEYFGVGGTELWMEAECGEVGSNWNVVNDATASNEKYATIRSGLTSGTNAPTSNADIITYTFSVEQGPYDIWGRVLLPTTSDDSFWIKLDNGSWAQWSPGTFTAWTWAKMYSTNLVQGEHTLTVAYREDGALLDKIYVGTTTPSGMGAMANWGCDASGIDTPDIKNRDIVQDIWNNGKTLYVKYNSEVYGSVYVEIYNITGQLVYNKSLSNISAESHTDLFTIDLKQGIYLIKSSFANHCEARKFAMQ